MTISVFDLFSIGVGPSSSHTVGPMLAACEFADRLNRMSLISTISRIQIDLYGSLALTGKGHGTDKAVLNGLEGAHPETVDPESLVPRMQHIFDTKSLMLSNIKPISFNPETDLCWHQKIFLPKHSNGLRFTVFNDKGETLDTETYYSIGGGFIVTEATFGIDTSDPSTNPPYLFNTADQLLELCDQHHLTIAELMFENEKTWRNETAINNEIIKITEIMSQCIAKGCHSPGILPGGLQVIRRAPQLYEKLQLKQDSRSIYEENDVMNYLNMYAMAVNEENAAGSRVVTAPTNGAAGIIPAVLEYYKNFHLNVNEQQIINFFLTAGAIGILYKKNASISGAEVGCQGEVGVACSMAAAGLTAALGGTIQQIENAAEIAMEHHLGMTCDPINGLVQIPCIERNAMGALKAVNACRMAMVGDGQHKVSLDKVIKTMWQTGKDMMVIYKETSQGGLAVNLPEC